MTVSAEKALHVPERDLAALLFTAEMYGVQLDLLAALLGLTVPRVRPVAARWRRLGYTESARLGPGPAWVWLTRRGLAACGLRYTAAPPALSRLAHLRAVTVVRLALEATSGYQRAGAYWRSERRLRARAGGRVGLREHLPDGEVHWPDGCGMSCAGECWAVEAELTPKTVARTVSIMRELLARTGDYGGAPGEAAAGQPPRHARVLYVCSAAAKQTVLRARDELGVMAARIEVRDLPPAAALAATVTPPGTAASHTAPDRTAPDRTAPDRTAPDRTAPDRATPAGDRAGP